MASAPATTGNTPVYRPLFKRVGQNELKDSHRSDFISELAAVATIVGVPLEEVYACAIKNGLPKHGPFWIDAYLVEKVFANFGWKSTEWKQVLTPLSGLPDIAILMIDYDEDFEVGRSVVYQRAASKSNPKGCEEWVIDPADWQPVDKQVTDNVKAIMPSWYIGVYPMPYPTSGIPKAAPVAKK